MQNKNTKGIKQQILFIDDLEKLIGRNRLTIRRWWEDGKFPAPTKLNGTNLAWHLEKVQDWIDLSLNTSGKDEI